MEVSVVVGTRSNLWRILRNIFEGLTMGLFLFLGGLFLTVWTWGVGAVIGVPMMILGLAFPFLEGRMGAEGKSWTGASPREPRSSEPDY